uniref:NFKB inhibitor interacting Ras-like 2 n=1 Tax=Hippocampus comes TaxID=109280 RepID=A0A3Q2YLX3_HIPCM
MFVNLIFFCPRAERGASSWAKAAKWWCAARLQLVKRPCWSSYYTPIMSQVQIRWRHWRTSTSAPSRPTGAPVSSIDSKESFKRMEALKKDIDRHRDKKEVTIVVLGNKLDKQEERRVDANMAQNWAKNEKVRLWELSVADRRTLIEPFVYLASKMTQPQSKSTFPLSRNKNKGSGPTDG